METLAPVLRVVARVWVGFALAFLVPLAWAASHDEPGLRAVWAGAFAATLAAGLLLALTVRRHRRELQPRDGFLLVTLVWVSLPAFGAVPLWLTVPGIDAGSVVLLTVVLLENGVYDDTLQALRMAAFHVVSLGTTTGYASTDYARWPVFAPVWLIFLGCFASCAGSTGGGIKMVRMIMLVKQARRELVRIIHPRVVNPVSLGGSNVPASVIANVLAYMLIYGASIVGLTMLLLMSVLVLFTTAFWRK